MLVEKIQLEPDETILIQVRKHWFVLLAQMLAVLFLALIPAFLYFFVVYSGIFETIPLSYTPNTALLITLYTAWLLIMWMGAFNIWNNYYLDVWTITNRRLIAVDQRGFFSRTTASFRLDRLQDITVSIRGIIATLLDFGALETQTAAEDRKFKATSLPHPGNLKALILESADKLAPDSETPTTGV